MLREAPERVSTDTYRCHGASMLHCLPEERINSLYYTGRRRCSSYCTNPATEQAEVGARLRGAYAEGCPAPPPPAREPPLPSPPPTSVRAPARRRAEPLACYLEIRFGREGRPFTWLTARPTPSALPPPPPSAVSPPASSAAPVARDSHRGAATPFEGRFNVTCSTADLSLRHMHNLYLHSLNSSLTMSLDGTRVDLHPFPTSAANSDKTTGRSSIRWRDAQNRYVFKALSTRAHGHRELHFRDVCLLQRLRGPSVPRVLCHSDEAMVMEFVGPALTVHNLPPDYRTQAERILDAMASAGIQHQDVHRWVSSSAFHTEFMVSAAGQMRLVDFGAASINTSGHVCESPADEAKFHGWGARGFEKGLCKRSGQLQYTCGSQDRDILGVLDAMRRVNESLDAYGAAGIRQAQPGFCGSRPAAVYIALGRKNASLSTFAAAHEFASHQWGTFVMPSASAAMTSSLLPRSHTSSFAAGRSIHPGHTPPTTQDVQACVERCRALQRCRAVSVSSSRRSCYWFASDCKSVFSLKFVDNGFKDVTVPYNVDNRTTSRLHWYDDFMTVGVRAAGDL
jgi:hypothetical protein